MSAGAPIWMKVSNTVPMRGSWVPVVSFPSEKVPAPPSPNWTLEAGWSSPVCQNRSTRRVRSSTGAPRSSTMEGSPLRARYSAAKSPAGPMPTTTGGRGEVRRTGGNWYACRVKRRTLSEWSRRAIVSSSATLYVDGEDQMQIALSPGIHRLFHQMNFLHPAADPEDLTELPLQLFRTVVQWHSNVVDAQHNDHPIQFTISCPLVQRRGYAFSGRGIS